LFPQTSTPPESNRKDRPIPAKEIIPDDLAIDEFAHRTKLPPAPISSRLRRRTAIVSRWLHIYLSMVAFAIILFFAVTGLTLNHADRFAGHDQVRHATGTMPHAWLAGTPDKLSIVEHLRTAHQIHGAVSDFRIDDQQLVVSFKGPGYTADAFIDRDHDTYDLTETRSGAMAVLNDLHRGAFTGPAWSAVIDACAILLTLVSLTGLLMLFFLAKRRTKGLLLAAAGAALCFLIYLCLIP
jgi:hypothetical protein